MELLKDGELDLLDILEGGIKTLSPENIKQIIVEDLNINNLQKGIDNLNKFKIQGEDGIGDVILTIHFNKLSYRWTKRFLLWRKYILTIILLLFSEERGDITKKIQKLLKKN